MAAQNEKREVIVTVNNGQALHSIKELESASRKLRQEWRKATTDGDRAKAAKDLKAVNTELGKLRAETRPAASGLNQVFGNLQKLLTVAAAFVGFQVITDAFRNMITRGAELSDTLANVRRTTGLTDEEVRKLDKDLGKLDTRSSRKELLELAELAGRLGVKGVANVRAFVEEADKINVALGDELGEDAILQLGKLASSFGTSMTKISSSVNTMGSETKATEGYMVDFTARMQGVGVTAKLGVADIIGYGAALDSMGLRVESSSTALNDFFIEFVKNTEMFGEVAGFAEGELSKLVGEKGTNAGFIAFLEKLKEANPESDKFLGKLEELGINGARGAQVFLALSNNLDLVKDSQQMANDAFDEGTSILDEFNLKNENFAGNVARVTRELQRWFMNSALMDGVESFFGTMAEYIKVPMSEKLDAENMALNVLIGTITDSNTGNEDRLKLLTQLQSEYPDFLKNIDAETVSNEQLITRLKEVNEQMINRIIIQRKQEELDAQNERTATAYEKMIERRTELQTKLIAGMREYGIELKANQSTEERIALLTEELAKKAVKTGTGKTANKNEEQRALEHLRIAMQQMEQAEAAYQARMAEGNDILSERDQMMKDLNIKTDVAPTAGGAPVGLELGGITSEADEKALKKAEDDRKKVIEQTKKYIQELQDLKIAAIENVEAREIAAADMAFERKREEILATEADEKVKKELIEQLWRDTEQKKIEISADAYQARLKAEADAVAKANDSELLTLQLKVDVAEEGSMEELDAVAALFQKQMEMELSNLELTTDQKLLIQQDYVARLNELWDQFNLEQQEKAVENGEWEAMNFEQRAQMANDYISTYGGMMQDMMNTMFDFASQNMEVEHDKFLETQQKEKDALDKQLANKTISQAQYNQRVAKMDEEREKRERSMKRKQFANEKASRITQAVINTALGVTSALATMPPASYIMAALSAAMGAAEIATIASQPNPYYKGGYTNVTDTEGARHRAQMVGSFADGGYYSNASYGVVGERGPELVIPNHVLSNPSYADAVAQIESAIYRKNASSSSAPTPSGGSGGAVSQAQNTSSTDPMLINAIDRQNQLMEYIIANGVQGVFPEDKLINGITNVERITGKNILSSQNNRKPGDKII